MLLAYVKNSFYNMVDNNSKTSSDNSEPEIDLSDFSTLKPFDMEPRKKASDENYTEYRCQPKDVLSEQRVGHNSCVNVVGFAIRWKQRMKVCVAGTIPKF